jgi:RNA polymerase sigma-70 factor (ECF subfamily)
LAARPFVGAAAIARAVQTFAARGDRWGVTVAPALVNGQPGFRTLDAQGRLVNVFAIDIADGRVVRMYAVANPDKLGHLGELSQVGLRPQFRGEG